MLSYPLDVARCIDVKPNLYFLESQPSCLTFVTRYIIYDGRIVFRKSLFEKVQFSILFHIYLEKSLYLCIKSTI